MKTNLFHTATIPPWELLHTDNNPGSSMVSKGFASCTISARKSSVGSNFQYRMMSFIFYPCFVPIENVSTRYFPTIEVVPDAMTVVSPIKNVYILGAHDISVPQRHLCTIEKRKNTIGNCEGKLLFGVDPFCVFKWMCVRLLCHWEKPPDEW